jgi:hypothetical protein
MDYMYAVIIILNEECRVGIRCEGRNSSLMHFKPPRELVQIKLVYTSCREHRGYCVAQLAVLLPAEVGTHFSTSEGWTVQLAGPRGRYTATAQMLLRSETSVSAESAPRPSDPCSLSQRAKY